MNLHALSAVSQTTQHESETTENSLQIRTVVFTVAITDAVQVGRLHAGKYQMKERSVTRRSAVASTKNISPRDSWRLVVQGGTVLSRPGRLIISIDYCPTTWSRTVPAKRAKKRSPARPPVLSKAAQAYAKKVGASRELSIKFLKEAGIIEKPGKLARPYR